LGLDGRVTKGHVDDYWVKYGSDNSDPFIGNWSEHTQGECTADFMGTNQSRYGNSDGSTTFYYYPDGTPLVDFSYYEPSSRDGCHGMKLFVESRGYQVVTNYTQLIYGFEGNTLGFTFENFKSEINAGRPVLIQVFGHTMIGYGYNDTGTIIYIHDTWNYNVHSMTWGGSYSDMAQWGVTVLRLASLPPGSPIVSTNPVSSITGNDAISDGTITSDGGVTVVNRGVCWSTSAHPTTADTCTQDVTGTGSFSSALTGLTPRTRYYVRAFATNSVVTSYGEDRPFTTSATTPSISTSSVTSISFTSATSGGSITSDGGAAVENRGACWSTSSNPTTTDTCTHDGTGSGSFASILTGLSPGVSYHVRAYATNSAGTNYGADRLFSTAAATAPSISTSSVTSISSTSATRGGSIISDGGAEVENRGVCWSTSTTPTISEDCTHDGTGTGIFSSTLTGLTPGTSYHVRAYATNNAGTSYGAEEDFSALIPDAADIAVTKSVNIFRPQVGEQVVFIVSATNLGPKDAFSVEITDRLPLGLSYIADDSGGAYEYESGIWFVGNLAKDETRTLSLTVLVDRNGNLQNTAIRSSSTPNDTNPDNDSDGARVIVGMPVLPWLYYLLW